MDYLSLLHWRAKVDSSSFKRAANAKFERWFNSSTEPGDSLDVEIDFPSLRADVGRNHRVVNRVLTTAIFAATSLLIFAAHKTWVSYATFRTFLARYHRQLGFPAYLRQNVEILASRPHQAYQEEQRRSLEKARATILFKRSREAIRRRLESLFNAVPDYQQRDRIRECLNRDDLEEMKSVAQELQGQTGQKTSEERLTALLETLKQYCDSEEFDRLCADALQILATAGFREARSFVVEAHDQLRARSKELEAEAAVDAE